MAEYNKEDLEEAIYIQVAEEVARGEYKPGLQARAIAETDGDERKARARYLKLRAEQLAKNFKVHLRDKRQTAIKAQLIQMLASLRSKLTKFNIVPRIKQWSAPLIFVATVGVILAIVAIQHSSDPGTMSAEDWYSARLSCARMMPKEEFIEIVGPPLDIAVLDDKPEYEGLRYIVREPNGDEDLKVAIFEDGKCVFSDE